MSHVSIVTQRRPLALASAANTTAISQPAIYAVSTTPPASATGRVVVPGVLNYLKIVPLFKTGSTSPAVRVTGWSFCKILDRWVPYHLCRVGLTLNTVGNSVNGTTLLGAYSMSLTSGDAKLFYEGTADIGNGHILIDTVGADLVEISFELAAGSSITCNAIIGEV